MMERRDPFGRMMTLPQVIDRLLEDVAVTPRDGLGAMIPAVNVYEEGDNLIVEAQLPGAKPEDIEVTIDGGTLTVRGQFREDEERRERNYLIREHRVQSFVRTLRLPDTVDPSAASASFENGILRLTFPRSERARARRIEVPSTAQKSATTNGQQQQQRGTTNGGAQAAKTGTPTTMGQTTSGATGQTPSGTAAGGTSEQRKETEAAKTGR